MFAIIFKKDIVGDVEEAVITEDIMGVIEDTTEDTEDVIIIHQEIYFILLMMIQMYMYIPFIITQLIIVTQTKMAF